MRTVIGIIIALFVITGASLTVLALWGVQPISWSTVWRSGVTVMIVSVVFVLLWLIKLLFFNGTFMGKSDN